MRIFLSFLVLLLQLTNSYALQTLKNIKAKGYVNCGVSQGLPGFSSPDKNGNWQGIDVDVCRAVAAAVLGDAKKVRYKPLSAKDRFTALQSGEIDVLSRNTTWTYTRDTSLGLDFTAVTYYDGQGFMVRKNSGVKSVNDLDGASICTNMGTTTELNLADYFNSHKMDYNLVTFEKMDEVIAAYDNGRCDAFTTDQSGLYAQRIKLKDPNAHIVLPEIISKEPLGPVVNHGDNHWTDIVRWIIFVMINAEEKGLNSNNVTSYLKSNDPEIKRILGIGSDLGEHLDLDKLWAYRIIKQVGNYGEIFNKNLGDDSSLKISRGYNNLWNKGGIIYAPPIR